MIFATKQEKTPKNKKVSNFAKNMISEMESADFPKTSSYWNVFMHMDDSEKIDLIYLLLKSLKHEKSVPEISPSDLYGIWGDDGMSDDQFLKELKSLRNFNQEIVEI